MINNIIQLTVENVGIINEVYTEVVKYLETRHPCLVMLIDCYK